MGNDVRLSDDEHGAWNMQGIHSSCVAGERIHAYVHIVTRSDQTHQWCSWLRNGAHMHARHWRRHPDMNM